MAMSLTTPDKISSLQRKLYGKAKAEPAYRFYLLYDKIHRPDILEYAYALAGQNDGAPGVDGVTFETVEAWGVEGWLAALREELASKSYRPMPVRRVKIPKPGGGERPLGIPTVRDRVVQTAANPRARMGDWLSRGKLASAFECRAAMSADRRSGASSSWMREFRV